MLNSAFVGVALRVKLHGSDCLPFNTSDVNPSTNEEHRQQTSVEDQPSTSSPAEAQTSDLNLPQAPSVLAEDSQETLAPAMNCKYSVVRVYPRRKGARLQAQPVCFGWGLYLDEGFAIPEILMILSLWLVFIVLFTTLGVAIAEFHRDRFSALGLPSLAVSAASFGATVLFRWADARK